MRCSILLIVCSSFIASSAQAAPKDELLRTETSLRQSQAKKAALDEESRKIEEELTRLQRRLVPSAEVVQRFEADLNALEDKLFILDEQLDKKQAELAAMKERQARLTQAVLRLSRTPPEAAMLMPGDKVESMKTARALEMTNSSIKHEADAITEQWQQLQEIREKIAKNRDSMKRKQEGLGKEQKRLRETVAQRRELQEKLSRQQKEEAEKIARLGKEAADLQALVSSLTLMQQDQIKRERLEKREQAEEASIDNGQPSTAPAGQKGKLRPFAGARGSIRSPVAGKLVQRYGARGSGATAKGVVIQTREKAQVTAPYDGEVVFAGPFLRYGPMVILRHSDDFHTLVAGLNVIDVKVGEFLLEGEPIGAMGEDAPGRLYLELRKHNQPVDPASWVRGMKK